MKLQRWHVARGGLDQGDCLDERGDWVRWADVLALLARIRAAVDAEREADPAVHHRCDCPFGWCDGSCPTLKARKALDALLADGGE